MSAAKRGFILVEVLIVIACLVALMAALAADRRVSLQETQDGLRRRRADFAARSAVALAVAELEQADSNIVTANDEWAYVGDQTSAGYDLGTATFRVEVVDAGSMVNINTAAEEQLQLLPIDNVMIASLLDWRDANLQPRPDGAKDEFYNALERPYNTRLGALQSLSELLLVKGWTARRLYTTLDEETTNSTNALEDENGDPLPLAAALTADSGCPNTRADGTNRMNLGSGRPDVQQLVQMGIPPPVADRIASGGPYSSFETLLTLPGLPQESLGTLLDSVTFTNSPRLTGKININTASRAVLLTLPGVTTDIADAIISQQSSGFLTLGELADIPGVTAEVLSRIADQITVGGDIWVIRAVGMSGGIGAPIEVTVRRDSDRVRIITWNRIASSKAPSWWLWDDAPTYTTTAGAL